MLRGRTDVSHISPIGNRLTTAKALNQHNFEENETDQALLFTSISHLRQRQIQPAMQILDYIIKRNPSNVEVHKIRATALLTHLRHILHSKDINLQLQQYSDALQIFSEIDKSFDKSTFNENIQYEILNNRGVCHILLSQCETALTHFNTAIRIKPAGFEVNFNEALVYRSQQQYERALHAFQSCIHINPHSYPALCGLAETQLMLHQCDAALHTVSLALTANTSTNTSSSTTTSHLEALIIRALCKFVQNNWDECVSDLKEYLVDMDSNLDSAAIMTLMIPALLKSAQLLIIQKNLHEAKDIYDEIIDIIDDHCIANSNNNIDIIVNNKNQLLSLLYYNKAIICYQLSQFESAIQSFKLSIKTQNYPNNLKAMKALCQVMVEVIPMAPSHSDHIDSNGNGSGNGNGNGNGSSVSDNNNNSYHNSNHTNSNGHDSSIDESYQLQLQRASEAYIMLQDTSKLCPEDPDILFLIGMVLGLLGRHDEAVITLRATLSLCSDHEGASSILNRYEVEKEEIERTRSSYRSRTNSSSTNRSYSSSNNSRDVSPSPASQINGNNHHHSTTTIDPMYNSNNNYSNIASTYATHRKSSSTPPLPSLPSSQVEVLPASIGTVGRAATLRAAFERPSSLPLLPSFPGRSSYAAAATTSSTTDIKRQKLTKKLVPPSIPPSKEIQDDSNRADHIITSSSSTSTTTSTTSNGVAVAIPTSAMTNTSHTSTPPSPVTISIPIPISASLSAEETGVVAAAAANAIAGISVGVSGGRQRTYSSSSSLSSPKVSKTIPMTSAINNNIINNNNNASPRGTPRTTTPVPTPIPTMSTSSSTSLVRERAMSLSLSLTGRSMSILSATTTTPSPSPPVVGTPPPPPSLLPSTRHVESPSHTPPLLAPSSANEMDGDGDSDGGVDIIKHDDEVHLQVPHETSTSTTMNDSNESDAIAIAMTMATNTTTISLSPSELVIASYELLKSPGPYPEGVDPAYRERHLSDDEFMQLFGMDKESFLLEPKWKQADKKKRLKLF